MRILLFGTYQEENHPRARVMAQGLASRGHHVAEANVPLGLSTADRVALLRSPTGGMRLLARLVTSWGRLVAAARRRTRHQKPDALLVGYMGHFDIWLARALFPRTTIVLDHLIFAASTAADRGVDRRLLTRALRLLDGTAIALADVVVVDTAEHAAMVPVRWTSKVVVVPVGASPEWFAASGPAPREPADRLSVVFYGLFTPLQGAETIGRAIAALKDEPVDFTMIGSGQDLDAARSAAEGSTAVTWMPWVPAADLPAVVARHDVGLGIFGTTPKAAKVVPNKVYQCAAAGLAVVTSDTPPQRRLLGDGASYVPAGDAQALAGVLRDLGADPARLAESRRRARAVADGAFGPDVAVGPLDAMLLNGRKASR